MGAGLGKTTKGAIVVAFQIAVMMEIFGDRKRKEGRKPQEGD
jgi:hypothetical protein